MFVCTSVKASSATSEFSKGSSGDRSARPGSWPASSVDWDRVHWDDVYLTDCLCRALLRCWLRRWMGWLVLSKQIVQVHLPGDTSCQPGQRLVHRLAMTCCQGHSQSAGDWADGWSCLGVTDINDSEKEKMSLSRSGWFVATIGI